MALHMGFVGNKKTCRLTLDSYFKVPGCSRRLSKLIRLTLKTVPAFQPTHLELGKAIYFSSILKRIYLLKFAGCCRTVISKANHFIQIKSRVSLCGGDIRAQIRGVMKHLTQET